MMVMMMGGICDNDGGGDWYVDIERAGPPCEGMVMMMMNHHQHRWWWQ